MNKYTHEYKMQKQNSHACIKHWFMHIWMYECMMDKWMHRYFSRRKVKQSYIRHSRYLIHKGNF